MPTLVNGPACQCRLAIIYTWTTASSRLMDGSQARQAHALLLSRELKLKLCNQDSIKQKIQLQLQIQIRQTAHKHAMVAFAV
jgi:hypothetical protein